MIKIDAGEQSTFPGWSFKVPSPDGTAYVIVMENNDGKAIGVHITIGKAGTQIAAWANATARLCSLALDRGAHVRDLADELELNTSDKVRMLNGKIKIRSGVEAVAHALREYVSMKNEQEMNRLEVSYTRPRLGVRNNIAR